METKLNIFEQRSLIVALFNMFLDYAHDWSDQKFLSNFSMTSDGKIRQQAIVAIMEPLVVEFLNNLIDRILDSIDDFWALDTSCIQEEKLAKIEFIEKSITKHKERIKQFFEKRDYDKLKDLLEAFNQ